MKLNKLIPLFISLISVNIYSAQDCCDINKEIQKNIERKLPEFDVILKGRKALGGKAKKEFSKNKVKKAQFTKAGDQVFFVRFKTLSSSNLLVSELVTKIQKTHQSKKIEKIIIVGHTDASPIRPGGRFKDNKELSVYRARAVADKLTKLSIGIPVQYDGLGETAPLASNTSAVGRSKNRRAEVHLYFESQKTSFSNTKEPKILYSYQCHNLDRSLLNQEQDLFRKKKELVAPDVKKPLERDVVEKAQKEFTVRFRSGQNNVEEEIRKNIFGYLEYIKSRGKLEFVHIVGHTDSDKLGPQSTAKYGSNLGLSKSRAQKIAGFIYKTYPDVDVSFDGRGAFEPVASNSTLAGKKKNRRVEVKFFLKNSRTSTLAGIGKDNFVEKKELNKKRLYAPGSIGGGVNIESPFKVTLDGQAISPNENIPLVSATNVDVQRCTDVALEGANLQVRYEPLQNDKYLNVSQIFRDGIPSFQMNSNYFNFIKKADLIILNNDSEEILEKVVIEKKAFSFSPLSLNLEKFNGQPVGFKVRVYDAKGRFDETVKQFIIEKELPLNHANFHENRIGVHGIPVSGGMVTVNGERIPSTHKVFVMGREIPADKNGKFAESQILKTGKNYGVEVSVEDPSQKGVFLKRDFHMPSNNWRAVGLADLTVGQNKSDGPVELITQDIDHYDNQVFIDGRIAMYIKGKIKGKYLLTMQVDTLEGTLEDAFDNFNDKDPQKLFRRIDPDAYYPIYGDDSTLEEDTPSQGKFYVRLEKGENHILWGNFKMSTNTENLAGFQRGLYGLKLHLETERQTAAGEKLAKLDVFAAEPGTLPSREELRGTGGIFYFLKNQDIVQGSERVQIIVRDRVSGLIEGTKSLTRGTDYTMNALSGFIYLNTPINSTASSSTVVSNNNIVGDPVYVAVTYEYSPTFTELDKLAVGGRGELSVSKYVRLGVTATKQDFVASDHQVLGLDANIKLAPMSHLKVEVAQSQGFGPNQYTSIDGGFGYAQIPQTTDVNAKANALKAEVQFKLYSVKTENATLKAMYSTKEAGFSSPGHLSLFETIQANSELVLPVRTWLAFKTKYSLRDQKTWILSEEYGAEIKFKFSKSWNLELGLLQDLIEDQSATGAAGTTLATDFGERTDLGLKLTFLSQKNWSLYAKGQNTISKDTTRFSNDRYALGASIKVGKRFKIDTEVSDGDLDFGGKLETTYMKNENTSFYTNYLLENNRTDGGFAPRLDGRNGSVTSGVKTKFLEEATVFYENRLADQFGVNRSQSLTHAMGLDWELNNKWSYNITGEMGRVENQDLSSRIDRQALSGSVAYSTQDTKWSSALEFRRDDSVTAVRKTLVTKNRFLKKLTPSWRLKTKFDMITSEATGGQFFDGDLTDAVLAFAYRPIENDKFNGLLKLRYFESLPSPGQVNSAGQVPEYLQRSWVWNMDGIWDLSGKWSLGLKYGMRLSRQRNYRQESSAWFTSNAQLGILRLDYHAPFKWDIHLEGRMLSLTSIDELKSGALIGVYRNFSENGSLKLGVGYNFTDFSNDLTRVDYNYDGWFVNFVGAF